MNGALAVLIVFLLAFAALNFAHSMPGINCGNAAQQHRQKDGCNAITFRWPLHNSSYRYCIVFGS